MRLLIFERRTLVWLIYEYAVAYPGGEFVWSTPMLVELEFGC